MVLRYLMLPSVQYLKEPISSQSLYIHVLFRYINMPELLRVKKPEEKIEHSPTLNTVFMVEEVLKDAHEVMSVAELKRRLPRKVMHNTLLAILDYLQQSGKIIIGTKGVLWIFTEREELNKLINQGTEL